MTIHETIVARELERENQRLRTELAQKDEIIAWLFEKVPKSAWDISDEDEAALERSRPKLMEQLRRSFPTKE